MLRLLAHILSFAFHPLLMPTYMLILLLLVNPYLFSVRSIWDQTPLILLVFLSTFALPAFGVLLMKFLGMVRSLHLRSRQERIGPYILTGIFYLWVFINFKNDGRIPREFTAFMLGATIALFLAFFLNNFVKISAHAAGMGGLLAMVVITLMLFDYDSFALETALFGTFRISMSALLMFVILCCGAVGSARLYLRAHELPEVVGGYLIGFFSQWMGLFWMS